MKLMCIFHLMFIVLSIPLPGGAYRILAVFPFNGPSHFVLFGRLVKELAARGHQVDVVSHYPLKKPLPNYNDVVNLAGNIPNLLNNMTYEFATNELSDTSVVVTIATRLGGDFCDLMGLPEFRKLIQNPPKDPPYDLLIVEAFGSTCYLALGKHFKVPVVAIVTSPAWPWVNGMVANPDNPSYIPNVLSASSEKMNFWQRMQNTLTLWGAKWQFSHYSTYQDEKIKKYIGPNAQSLEDAQRNVSLLLVNSHYSLHGVRPFTTAAVEIAGLHIKEVEEPLPDDLQKWLDDSTNGFVLITFGSMLRIETFPKETLIALYSSLEKLAPTRVLIKVVKKNKLPPGLPSNVLVLSWVPQSAVLAHSNIRAFVTHGGLMGTLEAIHRGVPMIGVPVYADQGQNMELYKRKKMAVYLDHHNLTEENFDSAFNTVLRDPSYMEAAKRVSAEFRDRPMSPVDTAIFWIEYVIRHGGTNLRSPAMDLAWWQIALLDIYGSLAVAAALAIYLLIFIAKYVILGSDSKETRTTKKNE